MKRENNKRKIKMAKTLEGRHIKKIRKRAGVGPFVLVTRSHKKHKVKKSVKRRKCNMLCTCSCKYSMV